MLEVHHMKYRYTPYARKRINFHGKNSSRVKFSLRLKLRGYFSSF